MEIEPEPHGRAIDAHVHVWSADEVRYPRRAWTAPVPLPTRPTSVESLLAAMDEVGVERAVLVQPSLYGDDHSYLRDAVAVAPERFAAVGLIDPLAGADALARFASLAEEPARPLRGIRMRLPGDRAAAVGAVAGGDDVLRAMTDRGLPLCVLTDPGGLDGVRGLAERHPRLTVVVDHLGSPGGADLDAAAYRGRLRRLSECSNISVKCSGFYSFSARPYPHVDCGPLVRFVVEVFGPERVIWGSDFPFVLDACRYASFPGQVDDLVPGLSPLERRQITRENALRIWW